MSIKQQVIDAVNQRKSLRFKANGVLYKIIFDDNKTLYSCEARNLTQQQTWFCEAQEVIINLKYFSDEMFTELEIIE